jgi:hypothetical protein
MYGPYEPVILRTFMVVVVMVLTLVLTLRVADV